MTPPAFTPSYSVAVLYAYPTGKIIPAPIPDVTTATLSEFLSVLPMLLFMENRNRIGRVPLRDWQEIDPNKQFSAFWFGNNDWVSKDSDAIPYTRHGHVLIALDNAIRERQLLPWDINQLTPLVARCPAFAEFQLIVVSPES
jgi:hypothetical protein